MCACLQIVQFMMPLARNFASSDAHNTLSAAWLSNRAVIQADRTWKLYVVRSNRGSIRPCPNWDFRRTARRHTRCRPACRERIRPLLLAREVYGGSLGSLNNAAVEGMVHTTSLILGDPPYIDEAKLRLAPPTVDRQFGEYRAVLTSAPCSAEHCNYPHRRPTFPPAFAPTSSAHWRAPSTQSFSFASSSLMCTATRSGLLVHRPKQRTGARRTLGFSGNNSDHRRCQ